MSPWWIIGVAVAAVGILASPVFAEPPSGTDPNSPDAKWYRSLEQPGTGYGCSSMADCRPVQFRAVGTHYEVFIDRKTFSDGDDAWHAVPDEVVIHDRPNPTGEAVACWYAQQVRCFVAPELS